MQLPILSYGHNILRKQCEEIDAAYPELDKLIDNMWETMLTYSAPASFALSAKCPELSGPENGSHQH